MGELAGKIVLQIFAREFALPARDDESFVGCRHKSRRRNGASLKCRRFPIWINCGEAIKSLLGNSAERPINSRPVPTRD